MATNAQNRHGGKTNHHLYLEMTFTVSNRQQHTQTIMAESHQQQMFDKASQVCIVTWDETIYSSFHIFSRIIDLAGLSWRDVVRMRMFNKPTIKSILLRVKSASEDDLRPLWSAHHGLCTSWAVLIAESSMRALSSPTRVATESPLAKTALSLIVRRGQL